MLNPATQIPTSCRGTIRALVKAHTDWPNYLRDKGLVSASARNADLLDFALKHADLAQKIEAILQGAPIGGATQAPEALVDDSYGYADIATGPEAPADAMPPEAPAEGTGALFDLDTVLAPVDQLLAPLLRKELASTLASVIAAANKPAVEVERVVEVERIVELAPGEAPRPASRPKARRDKRVTFRALFPSKSADKRNDAPLTMWAGAKSPEVDPNYVVNKTQMHALMTAIERAVNAWLTGPAGTGKTTMAEYAAAALGRPYVRIGMTRQTEIADLVGGQGLHNGATVWEDGVLIAAMRQPGTVILFDEVTFAPPDVQSIVQHVADEHRAYTLPTGETVKAADGVVFMVADNTAGSGDEGGLYAGTNVSNAALVTRFSRTIVVDYLTAKEEAQALANRTACPLPAARHVADFFAQARRNASLQGVVLSLRQMIGFVQCVQDGIPAAEAFKLAISNRMPAVERATIEVLADLAWSSTFDALIQGKGVPATPSDSAASQAFADNAF